MPFALFVRDRGARRTRPLILGFAALLSSLAVAATAPTAEAQATVPISVTVWRVVKIDDPDPADVQAFGDYYTNISIFRRSIGGSGGSASACASGSARRRNGARLILAALSAA